MDGYAGYGGDFVHVDGKREKVIDQEFNQLKEYLDDII